MTAGAEKTFTEVTVPKSIVFANFTTSAYEQPEGIPAVFYFIRLLARNQGETEKPSLR